MCVWMMDGGGGNDSVEESREASKLSTAQRPKSRTKYSHHNFCGLGVSSLYGIVTCL